MFSNNRLRHIELLLVLSLVFSGGALFKISGHYFRIDMVLFLSFVLTALWQHRHTSVEKRVLYYPAALMLVMIGSTLLNLNELKSAPYQILHDILSYGFIFSIIYSVMQSNINIEKILSYFVIVFLILGLVGSFFDICYTHYLIMDDPSSNLTHTNRFSFLSYTANQIALIILTIPFIVFYLYERRLLKNRLFTLSLSLVAFYLGSITHSRALFLAWIFPIFIYVATSVYEEARTTVGKYLVLSIFVTILLLIFACLYYYFVYNDFPENNHRFALFSEAFRMIRHHFILGLGAGPHVTLSNNPRAYIETHNSYLDLLTQVGLLGFTFYFMMLLAVFKKIKSNLNLVLLFIALHCFIFFHLMLRHPIYWIVLFWLYTDIRPIKIT